MGSLCKRTGASLAIAGLMGVTVAEPASAYLFWRSPQLKGEPVKGDEPGLLVPLPGATDKEIAANLLWSMRAGLNVAALQCQFAPALLTVGNYNAFIKNHAGELGDAYKALEGYFKRQAAPVAVATGAKGKAGAKGAKVKVAPVRGGPAWSVAIDQYATRAYNGFSTFHGQLEFCETASSIGREALSQPRGQMLTLAQNRMREFRNSLSPAGDMVFAYGINSVAAGTMPPLECYNKRGKVIACKD